MNYERLDESVKSAKPALDVYSQDTICAGFVEHMKEAGKFVLTLGLSFLVGFYTAFTLMMLWDWFVTSAFHVSEIGYWNMVGLTFIVRVITPTPTLGMVQKLDRATKMLEACIPEEKRAATMATIGTDSLSDNVQMLISCGMTFFNNTIFLVIGFGVHTFMM